MFISFESYFVSGCETPFMIETSIYLMSFNTLLPTIVSLTDRIACKHIAMSIIGKTSIPNQRSLDKANEALNIHCKWMIECFILLVWLPLVWYDITDNCHRLIAMCFQAMWSITIFVGLFLSVDVRPRLIYFPLLAMVLSLPYCEQFHPTHIYP